MFLLVFLQNGPNIRTLDDYSPKLAVVSPMPFPPLSLSVTCRSLLSLSLCALVRWLRSLPSPLRLGGEEAQMGHPPPPEKCTSSSSSSAIHVWNLGQ